MGIENFKPNEENELPDNLNGGYPSEEEIPEKNEDSEDGLEGEGEIDRNDESVAFDDMNDDHKNKE